MSQVADKSRTVLNYTPKYPFLPGDIFNPPEISQATGAHTTGDQAAGC